MNKNIWIVIPARYKSQRFPGKPLARLHSWPMIVWVLEACQAVAADCEVVVATDDKRIADVVESYGGRVEMTAEYHKSGTERVVEVAQRNPDVEWFVNVQGDEPGIEPELIEKLIVRLQECKDLQLVVSAASLLKSREDYLSPHIVKVVTDLQNRALYFSRSPIPFFQNVEVADINFTESSSPVRQHLGIYGYSGSFLRNLASLSEGVLAKAENLEQLNWLENGFPIEIIECDSPWSGIDTPEELERFAALWHGAGFVRKGV